MNTMNQARFRSIRRKLPDEGKPVRGIRLIPGGMSGQLTLFVNG